MSSLAQNRDTEGSKSPSQDAGDFVHVQSETPPSPPKTPVKGLKVSSVGSPNSVVSGGTSEGFSLVDDEQTVFGGDIAASSQSETGQTILSTVTSEKGGRSTVPATVSSHNESRPIAKNRPDHGNPWNPHKETRFTDDNTADNPLPPAASSKPDAESPHVRRPPAAPSKPDVETPDEEKPPAVPRRQNTPPAGASPGGGGGDDSGGGSQSYVDDMSDDDFSTTSDLTQHDFVQQQKRIQELERVNRAFKLRTLAQDTRLQEQEARLDFQLTFKRWPDRTKWSSRSPTEVYTTIQNSCRRRRAMQTLKKSKQAATMISKTWRRKSAMTMLKVAVRGATLCKAEARRLLQERDFQKKLRSIARDQAIIRSFIVRRNIIIFKKTPDDTLALFRLASLKGQIAFAGFAELCKFVSHPLVKTALASTTIQRIWRGYECRRAKKANHVWDFRNKVGMPVVREKPEYSGLAATLHGGAELTAEGLKLDGKSGYAKLSNWEWGGTTSIEVYVKYDSFNRYSRVFDFGNGPSIDNVDLLNHETTSTIGWQVLQGSGRHTQKVVYGEKAISSVWTHVVVTVSGTTMKVYKNGVLTGTRTDGHEPNILIRTQHWLGRSSWNTGYFDGTIAYLKMWHGHELQQSEVTALYLKRNKINSYHVWDFRNKVGMSEVKDNHSDLAATLHGGAELTAEGLKLDGKSGYAKLSNWEWGGTTSIEVYVKYDSFNRYSRVFDFGNGPSIDNVDLLNHETTSTIGWQVLQGSGRHTQKVVYGEKAISSVWTHVVVTVSGTTMKVYKNGVLTGTRTDGHEPNILIRTQHWLGRSSWNTGYFDGTIAYLKMWHGHELQQSEVTALYLKRNKINSYHVWDFRNKVGMSEVKDNHSDLAATLHGGAELTAEGLKLDGKSGYAKLSNWDGLAATLHGGAELTAEGLKLDGKSGYAKLSNWEWGGTTSFEVYVKYDSFNSFSRVFDFSNGEYSDNVFLTNSGSTSSIRWDVYQGSTKKYLTTSKFDSSTWTHVVVTVSGTTMKIYKNGVLAGTKTDGWEPNILTRTQHWLGRSAYSHDGYFDGTIAYLKMWHGVELQQSEVTARYENREKA
eukprot:CAMPEP_0182520112 /NCGR_PEP_ID=MMETSP1321-20130603/45424_1 /TAXON_ID=91990 /ORGANISM="Bolidomonas sp., Strain RCC1657" /LENGTH=1083 /DNA_ID=CAMNT_0024728117 /DNA_START=32 /DNA_END=3284 /DNA_ORIENTATION=+